MNLLDNKQKEYGFIPLRIVCFGRPQTQIGVIHAWKQYVNSISTRRCFTPCISQQFLQLARTLILIVNDSVLIERILCMGCGQGIWVGCGGAQFVRVQRCKNPTRARVFHRKNRHRSGNRLRVEMKSRAPRSSAGGGSTGYPDWADHRGICLRRP